MKRKFKQLSYEERIIISVLHNEGWSLRQIGKKLKRSHSSIQYEIREKSIKNEYTAKKAQSRTYWRRYRSKQQCLKIAMDQDLSMLVQYHLKEQELSPEVISGYLERQGIHISSKAIYNFIKSRCLSQYLFWSKHKKKSRNKKHKKANDGRKYIEQRPKILSSGHYEADFIVSSKSSYVLLVIVDIYTRETIVRVLPNRKHATALRVFKEIFRDRPVKTITLDNDIAFNCWRKLEARLKCSIYFCHPYRSWEKGLVENTNRWIRCFIPKRFDIKNISKALLRKLDDYFNNRPRACLGFKTVSEFKKYLNECTN